MALRNRRPGFIVKNASDDDVTNLDIAEPDSVDFNLLGNGRFGVISGCEVTATGGASSVVNVSQGIYIVDGLLIRGGGQFTLQGASQHARFDLIVGDTGGHVMAITGDASDNPVFPDCPNTVTVFAAVSVKSGGTPVQQNDITDKRIMLPERFVTSILQGSLLHNGDPNNALATLFDIDWNGKQQWDGDAFLERVGIQTLKVTRNLNVTDTLHARDETLDGTLTAAGDVISANLKKGTANPTGTANPGDLYRNVSTGTMWLYEGGSWQQMSTVPIPVGFTMMGFVTSAPVGWLLVNGQQVSRVASGGLWDAFPAWRRNVSGNEMVLLPDAKDCFFGWGQPGIRSGQPSPSVTLTEANLPSHRHLTSPSGQMNAAGSHTHSTTVSGGGGHTHSMPSYEGQHSHGAIDLGHNHIPQYDQGGFICAVWEGHNKVDGYFNDASHTYTVEPLPYTNQGYANILIEHAGQHVHSLDTQGAHVHTVTLSADQANHTHPINELPVGSGVPIDIRPPFMGVYLYIKI